MKRRALLATVAGGLAATAGCVGRQPAGGQDRTTSTTTTTTGTTGDPGDGSDDGSGDEGDGDGSDDGDAHGVDLIADVGCPSFAENVDRTNCYREITRTNTAVFLAPSTHRFEEYAANDAVETVQFTLHNTGDATFRFNPHDWAVHVYRDDEWSKVAPDAHGEPLVDLDPGGTVAYSLSTEAHPSSNDDVRQLTADLDSGHTHAFRLVGILDPDGAATRIEAVALFDYLEAVP